VRVSKSELVFIYIRAYTPTIIMRSVTHNGTKSGAHVHGVGNVTKTNGMVGMICGMVWYGMALVWMVCGMIWYGMWYGMVCGIGMVLAWCGMGWYGMVWCGMICGMVYGMV